LSRLKGGARPGLRRRASARDLFIALCLGAADALGAWPASWYTPDYSVAAFFVPAGLTLSVLALTPSTTWPLLLVAAGAAEFGVDAGHHLGVALSLGYALAHMAEPLVGALLLRGAIRWRMHDGYRARLVGFTLCGVALGPVVGAAVGATAVALFSPAGDGWWDTAGTWWVGDALGVLVIGSVILAWSRRSPFEGRAAPAMIATLAGLAAGVIVVSGVLWSNPVVYVLLPLLVCAAFAGGSRAVTAVGAAGALATEWVAISGRASHLLASVQPENQLLYLQLFLAVTLLTGMILAVEIAERRRSEHLARKAESERLNTEAATIKAAAAERHSITQDTHDIVGHGLSVMLLQLGAARQVFHTDPALAHELLGSIEAIGRGACQDLDVAMALFGHEPELRPGRGLDELAELVESVGAAGLRVELQVEGERRQVSPIVEWSAYRIVQEALTNVARHAPGAKTTVNVRFDEQEVRLSILDDGGAATDAPRRSGRGIVGMRERASALGGTLVAGPRRAGGFRVVARLPRLRTDLCPFTAREPHATSLSGASQGGPATVREGR
jgi:signal transduction histidine kinase